MKNIYLKHPLFLKVFIPIILFTGSSLRLSAVTPTPTVTDVNSCGSSKLATTATGSLLWNTGATTSSITVTASGTYSVTATVSGSTSAAGTGAAAPLTVPAAPVVTDSDNCNGTSLLTASGYVDSVMWAVPGGSRTSSILVTLAGTYSVVQTVGGCVSPAGTAIASPRSTPARPTVTDTNSCGSSLLYTTSTGALLWSNSATTSSITVTNATVYGVTTTVNGCTSPIGAASSAPLTIPSVPTVTVTNDCGYTVLYTPSSGSLSWNTGATTASLTVTVSATYSVTATVSGCTGGAGTGTSAPKTIPAAPDSVNDVDNCNNTSTLTVSGYTGTLQWEPGGSSASSILVSTAGTYSVTQTVSGCASPANTIVASPRNTPARPVVTVTGNCNSTSTLSTVSTGALLWSNGATTSSITETGTAVYDVTTTVNGCPSPAGAGTATPTTTPSTPAVTAVNNCDSSKLSTTATGSLLWNTGATSTSITITASGTYSVTRTISECVSGAGTGAASPLTVPSSPVVTVANYCSAPSVLSTTSTGTLLWSNSATTTSITVTTAGTYTLTQTATNGCTSAAGSGTAILNTTPASPVVTDADDCGSSVLSTAASGALLWSTGATTTSITVTAAGNYSITQTINGCTSSAGTGAASPLIIPSAPSVSEVDNCGSSVLSTAASGTLLWSTGATSSGITVTTSGTYSVTTTIGDGCSNTAGITASVTIPTIYYADVDGDHYLDSSNQVSSCTGAPAGYYPIYTLPHDSTIGYETTPRLAGDHLWDCNDSCTLCIPQAGHFGYEGPSYIHPGAQELCNGIDDNCNGYIDDVIHDGLTYSTFYVDMDGDGFGNAAVDTVSCLSSEPYSYMTFQDANGDDWSLDSTDCNDDPTTAGGYIHKPPVVTITGGVALCSGTATTLHPYSQTTPAYYPFEINDSLIYNRFSADSAAANGNTPYQWITYSWSGGATTEDINISAIGTYSITITQFGCVGTGSVSVSANPQPSATISLLEDVSCPGGSNGAAAVSASGGAAPYSYLWSPSGGTDSVASGLSEGDYAAIITDANGCSASDIVSINLSLHNTSSTAISFEPYNIYTDYSTGDTSVWFKFTAYSNPLSINITKPINSIDGADAIFQSAKLYSGRSDSLTFVDGWYPSVADSGLTEININYSGLTMDSSYYLLLSRTDSGCADFAVVTGFVLPPKNCGGSFCDLVGDGDFSGYMGCSNDTIPFGLKCVPCWSCSHGTPQIGGDSTNRYAFMWADSEGIGEGIQNTLDTTLFIGRPNLMYVFEMKYRMDSLSPPGSSFDIHARLTTYAQATTTQNPPFGCAEGYGSAPPVPNADTLTIITVPNVSSSTWVDTTVCRSSLDLTIPALWVLWIYPTTSDGKAWMDVDDIHIYVIDADLGDSETCICSPSTLKPVNCPPPGNLDISYQWYENGDSIFGATADTLFIYPDTVQTIYSLTMTYGSCSASSHIKIDPRCTPPLSITPAPAQICSNKGSMVFSTSPSGAGYIWHWSTGATTSSIVVTAVVNAYDTIAVIDTNNYGCKGMDSLIFHWLPYPTIHTSDSGSCNGSNQIQDTVTITGDGSMNVYKYAWSPSGDTTSTVTLAPGSYIVQVTDSNQCVGIGNVIAGFSINDTLILHLPTCINNGSLIAKIDSMRKGTYIYTWTLGLDTISSDTTTATSNTIDGLDNGTYFIKVTDSATTCYVIDSVNLNNNFYFEPIKTTNTACIGNIGTAILTLNPLPLADTMFTYTWTNGHTTDSITSKGQTDTIRGLAADTYTVTVTSGDCSTLNYFTISLVDTNSLKLTPDSSEVCGGKAWISVQSADSVGPFHYQWSTGRDTISSLKRDTVSGFAGHGSRDTLMVTVTDTTTHCTATDTFYVTVDTLPTISINPADTTACQGQLLTLHASGGGTYIWRPATGLSDSTTANPVDTANATTTYTVTGTTGQGCTGTDTVTVYIKPNSTSSTTAVSCYNYSWHDSTYTASGTYIHDTINAAGCDSVITLYLTINDTSTSSASDTACYYYTWHGTAYFTSGTYMYDTTNAAGCDSVATLHLTINPNPAGPHIVGLPSGCNTECLILDAPDSGFGTTPPYYVQVYFDTTYRSSFWFNADTINSYCGVGINGNYSFYVTDSNGCSISVSINIVDSINLAEIRDSSGYIPSGTYSGTYSLLDNVIINTGATVTFSGLNLSINSGVSITVDSGATLIINCASDGDSSYLHACDSMWVGIIVMPGGALNIECGSDIEDAQYAVEARNESGISINHSTFNRDYVGIYVPPDSARFGNTLRILYINGTALPIISYCKFTCTSNLNPGFTTQAPPSFTHTFAGIYINDLTNLVLTLTNTFDSLNNGIYAARSNLALKAGIFKNISSYDYLAVRSRLGVPVSYIGAGIYATGNGQLLSYQGNIADTTVNDFLNCTIGIEAAGMTTSIQTAYMMNVYGGIYVQSCSGKQVSLTENTISATFRGIGLYRNDGAAEMAVTGNTIKMIPTKGGLSDGIYSSEFSGLNTNSFIDNNSITMGNSRLTNGVNLESVNSYAVGSNYIHLINLSSLISGATSNGIKLVNSPNSITDCNIIIGTIPPFANTLTSSGAFAVHTYGCSNYLHKCDSINYTYYGFDFYDVSDGRLQSNSLNAHTNSLNVDLGGMMGFQFFEGNRWNLQGNNLSAWDQSNYENDIFTVPTGSSSTYLPPSAKLNPPLFWFQSFPGTNSVCGSSCSTPQTGGGGIHGHIYPRYMDATDSLIAIDSIHTPAYDEQTVWKAQRMLMEKLLYDTALVSTDSAITNFYNAHLTDNIGLLSGIRLAIDTLNNPDSATTAVIQTNLDTINANVLNINSAATDTSYSGGLMVLTSISDSLYNVYMTAINVATAANDSIYTLIQSVISARAGAIGSSNAALSTSKIYEQNEIDVNNIYLNTIAIGQQDSIINDSIALYNIARQCPLSGGPAVYYARSLYDLINDSMIYDDDQICGSPSDTCLVPTTPGIITGMTYGVCNHPYCYAIDSMSSVTGYTWTVIGNAAIDSGQGSTKIWVTFTDTFTTGIINVYATNSCGSGAPRALAVSGFPAAPDSISGPAAVCAYSTSISFSTDTSCGATSYIWTVPSGCTIDSGQGTTRIVADWDSIPGNVIVVGYDSCGTSDSTFLFVDITECRMAKAKHIIAESPANGDVKLYPNPTTGIVTVIYRLNSDDGVLQLYDVIGKLVGEFKLSGSGNAFEFDASYLCCGTFEYRVMDNEALKGQGKLVIIR